MAWVTPKTSWGVGEDIYLADMNRIEGNEVHLGSMLVGNGNGGAAISSFAQGSTLVRPSADANVSLGTLNNNFVDWGTVLSVTVTSYRGGFAECDGIVWIQRTVGTSWWHVRLQIVGSGGTQVAYESALVSSGNEFQVPVYGMVEYPPAGSSWTFNLQIKTGDISTNVNHHHKYLKAKAF